MTTAGATSGADDRVTHTSELVERHRITMPVGATGDNVAVARLHAEAYARARGFELSPGSIGVIQTVGRPAPQAGYLGVSFDVVVGKGDIHLDQRVPGVLDRWTWSAGAFEWWRRILNRADGREGRILSLVDAQDRRRLGRITGVCVRCPVTRTPSPSRASSSTGAIRQVSPVTPRGAPARAG